MVSAEFSPELIFEETTASNSGLAGTGAGGQMVGGHASQGLRRVAPSVAALFSTAIWPDTAGLAERTTSQRCAAKTAFRPASQGRRLGTGLQAVLPFLPQVQDLSSTDPVRICGLGHDGGRMSPTDNKCRCQITEFFGQVRRDKAKSRREFFRIMNLVANRGKHQRHHVAKPRSKTQNPKPNFTVHRGS